MLHNPLRYTGINVAHSGERALKELSSCLPFNTPFVSNLGSVRDILDFLTFTFYAGSLNLDLPFRLS